MYTGQMNPCPDSILQSTNIVTLRQLVKDAHAADLDMSAKGWRALAEARLERWRNRMDGDLTAQIDFTALPAEYFDAIAEWHKRYGGAMRVYVAAKNHECWKAGLFPCELVNNMVNGVPVSEAIGWGPLP